MGIEVFVEKDTDGIFSAEKPWVVYSRTDDRPWRTARVVCATEAEAEGRAVEVRTWLEGLEAGTIPKGQCLHGFNETTGGGTAGRAELSSCCNVAVTYSGDGELYCKCCHGDVEWDDDLQDVGMVHIIEIPKEEEGQ